MSHYSSRERKRVKTTINRHGTDAFREWGKKGGNPILNISKEDRQRFLQGELTLHDINRNGD
jgi:hypothetical protein